jgi:cell division protein FtsQ
LDREDMDEKFTIRPGHFLRPKRRHESRGGERYRRILWRAIQSVSCILFFSLLLFVGHGVYAHLLENPSFRIREVEVKGTRKIPKETLLSLASIEGATNLFAVRLGKMVERLESHPWIEAVEVRKVFPNRLVIEVEERRPIAILQLENLYYIDAKGTIFSRVGDRDGYNYPFLTGVTRQTLEKEPEEAKYFIMKALELLLTADREKLFPVEEISEVHVERISGIRFFIRVEGLEVKMGWDNFSEKLKRLSMIQTDLRKRKITAVSIDCRDASRMFVKRELADTSRTPGHIAAPKNRSRGRR